MYPRITSSALPTKPWIRGLTHYAPNRGLLTLREEISKKLWRDNAIQANPETEILVTSGCAEALYLAFVSLVEPGDEVIIIEPAYISYLQLSRAAHATPVFVHAKEENGWMPDMDELRAAVTEKTKLLVLNSPSNPTGIVYPREVLEQIAALAIEKDFLVLSDEVYENCCLTIRSMSPSRRCPVCGSARLRSTASPRHLP